MKLLYQDLTGIRLDSGLSFWNDNNLARAGSDIGKHSALFCYIYSVQAHFGVLTRDVSSPSNGDSPLAYKDPRFENRSARYVLCDSLISLIRDWYVHHFKVLGLFDTSLIDLIMTFRSLKQLILQ